jgi:RNA polymerase sigma factor (sigma-70 family)
MDNMTEEEILIGLRQNDRQITKYLYKRLAPPIYAYVRDHGGNVTDFKDLYQDTFLKVLQNIHNDRYNERNQFHAWFFSIARYTWADRHRQQQRFPVAGDENLLRALADDAEASEDALRQLILHDKKLEVLNKVWGSESWKDSKCHRFLNAFHYKALSFKEIAAQEEMLKGYTLEALEAPENKTVLKQIQTNIGVQLHNCRKKLFRLVEEQLVLYTQNK